MALLCLLCFLSGLTKNSRKNSWIKKTDIALAFIFICIFILIYIVGVFGKNAYLHRLYGIESNFNHGDLVELSGIVVKIEEKEYYSYYYIEDVNVSNEDSSFKVDKVILLIEKDKINRDLEVGRNIRCKCIYKTFSEARNIGNFDEKKYYYSIGISGKFYLDDNELFICNMKSYYRNKMYRLKKYFEGKLAKISPKKYFPLFEGIIFGDKFGIDDETKEIYKLSGISHLLAISGLHISIIGMCLYRLCRKFILIIPSAVVAGITVVSYGIMVGDSVSATRAIVMFLIKILADVLGRTYDVFTGLTTAFIIVYVTNPLCLENGGMLLSFGAIIGITLVYDTYSALLKFKGKIAEAIVAGESISMVTKPLLLQNYYEVCNYSLVLNIIVVPLMSMVVISGLSGIIASTLSITLGKILIFPGYLILRMYDMICKFTLSLPYAVTIGGIPGKLNVLVYYIVLAITMAFAKIFINRGRTRNGISVGGKALGELLKSGVGTRNGRSVGTKALGELLKSDVGTRNGRSVGTKIFEGLFKSRKSEYNYCESGYERICIRGIYVALIILLNLIIFGKWDNRIKITMVDVGQGECICINDGKNVILTDAGSTSIKNMGKYVVLPYLKASGVKRIDFLIVTHSDSDHINGMGELMNYSYNNECYVKNLVLADIAENAKNQGYIELVEQAERLGINIVYVKAGDKIEFPDYKLNVIWPEKGDNREINQLSVVYRLEVAGYSMLFTGDLGEEGEKFILDKDNLGKADILKVGHHGSSTSSTEEFLDAVNPKVAIISCGEGNSYGHPHRETLERLNAAGADVFRTDESGGIEITVGEGKMEILGYLR